MEEALGDFPKLGCTLLGVPVVSTAWGLYGVPLFGETTACLRGKCYGVMVCYSCLSVVDIHFSFNQTRSPKGFRV